MNQRLLIGIIILTGIGSITAVSAYSGSISAAQGNFNNVLVTGTCSGCGASEGSFTSYNTIILNSTLGLGGTDAAIRNIQINNNGTVIASGDTHNFGVKKDGTLIFNHFSNINTGGASSVQSVTGKYQILVNDDATPIISLYNNSTLVQVLGINMAQFSSPSSSSALGIAISPDGKYIAVLSEDTGAADNRLVILKGS